MKLLPGDAQQVADGGKAISDAEPGEQTSSSAAQVTESDVDDDE